jgi:hypothetical protein
MLYLYNISELLFVGFNNLDGNSKEEADKRV